MRDEHWIDRLAKRLAHWQRRRRCQPLISYWQGETGCLVYECANGDVLPCERD